MKKVTKDNVYIGAKVVRGADWKWHLVAPKEIGIITEKKYLNPSIDPDLNGNNSWVNVQWDKHRNDYRVGPEHHDLYFWEDEFVTKMKEILEEDGTGT